MKWITEWKYNRLVRKAEEGLRNEDGSVSGENFYIWTERLKALDGYRIIGIRHAVRALQIRREERKLRHLKLGTVYFPNQNGANFEIRKVSPDLLWQTNLYLAVIIRDYLRLFRKKTPVIGNCVFSEHPAGMTPAEAQERDDLTDHYTELWQEKLKTVSEEFDWLARLMSGDSSEPPLSDAERQERIRKAFADLAEIYEDLVW